MSKGTLSLSYWSFSANHLWVHLKSRKTSNLLSKAAVSKNGKQYEIFGLELTDPQVVHVLEAAEKDGADLVDYVTKAVGIGVRALQATNVSLGVEALTDEITRTRGAMSEASQKWVKEIEDKVKSLTGDEGTLAKSLEALLGDFSEELTNLTGGENSPICEGIKKQMADIGAEPVGNKPEEMAKQIKEETEKFARLVKDGKITLE